MKTFFITLAAFFICAGCLQAQTRKEVKLYAYKQPVIGGAPQKATITEHGQSVENNNNQRSRTNYLIYLEYPSATRIIPVELWLEGENYGVSSTDIKTPVEINTGNLPGQDKANVLVPQTSNKVVQLNIRPITVSKANAAARAASGSNQVVLVYKVGSQFYHAVVKELSIIEPVVLQ